MVREALSTLDRQPDVRGAVCATPLRPDPGF